MTNFKFKLLGMEWKLGAFVVGVATCVWVASSLFLVLAPVGLLIEWFGNGRYGLWALGSIFSLLLWMFITETLISNGKIKVR